MKNLIRSLFLMVLCFLVTDLVAQPAHVKEMKRRKEAMKKEREYEREYMKDHKEAMKKEREYEREMRKAEDESYRELMKADDEAYREYMKDRKEAMKEGRRLPPPPGYGPPFDRNKYDEEYYEDYEYDDYEYDDEYEDDRYEKRRRRPTHGKDGGEVIIQGEVKVKGRKRIPIPKRRKGGGY